MGEGFRSTRLAPRHNHNTHERLWWRGSKTAFWAPGARPGAGGWRALKDGQSCLYSKPPPAQAPSEG